MARYPGISLSALYSGDARLDSPRAEEPGGEVPRGAWLVNWKSVDNRRARLDKGRRDFLVTYLDEADRNPGGVKAVEDDPAAVLP